MDKTMQIAKWLYDNNPEFSSLKSDESWQLMQSVMALAHIYLYANGMGELLPHPLAVGKNGVHTPELDTRRAELHKSAAAFEGEELHALNTINRRFAYSPAAALAKGLIEAEPFAQHRNAAAASAVIIDDADIPEPFLRSMRAIHDDYADSDFRYKVVKVNGRNFFAEPDFELMVGDYADLARAMKEGYFEEDRSYRLSRGKTGDLLAY